MLPKVQGQGLRVGFMIAGYPEGQVLHELTPYLSVSPVTVVS